MSVGLNTKQMAVPSLGRPLDLAISLITTLKVDRFINRIKNYSTTIRIATLYSESLANYKPM